jgi:hypothetical protein
MAYLGLVPSEHDPSRAHVLFELGTDLDAASRDERDEQSQRNERGDRRFSRMAPSSAHIGATARTQAQATHQRARHLE